MNYKNYYDISFDNIPYIDKSDLVPGTFLVGTRELLIVYTFPIKPTGYDNTAIFYTNKNLIIIVSVLNDDEKLFGYMGYDLILLNITQNILFFASSKSKLFVKFGSP